MAELKTEKPEEPYLVTRVLGVITWREITKFLMSLRVKAGENRKVLGSIAALSSSNVVASLLGAVGGLLVAHFIGPEETGLFRSFTIPLTYLTFLHLGTFDGLWRQIPYYSGKQMPEKIEALASAAGFWNLYTSIVVASGFLCLALYCFWRGDMHGVLGWGSQVFCCWGIFYGGYLSSTYRTLHHFVALARIQMMQSVLSFGMVFLLPFLGFSALCARSAAPPMLGVLLCQRNRPLKIPYRFNATAFGELIRVGLPFSFWGSLYTSVWIATESLLMLKLGGISGLGLFSVAIAMREGINALPMATYQVMTPRVVTAFAREGSVREANSRVIWITTGLVVFMVLFVFLVSFALDIVVPHVIPKYTDGIALMKVCLWFAVVQAASLPLNTLFALGKPWLYGRGVLFGLIVFPLATYFLVPVYGGILAVAVGSLLGRVARTVAAYIEITMLARKEA